MQKHQDPLTGLRADGCARGGRHMPGPMAALARRAG